MSSIEALTDRLEEAQLLLRERQSTAADFMARMSMQSLRAHVADLQHQLRIAKEERAVEIVEVRLTGEVAQSGSLPLYLLSDLSKQLANALYATSQRLKSGKRVRRISPAVVNQLDLRLADLAPGSTRLFIRGNTSPDLFGYSLLENSIEALFGLLNATDEGDLARAVSAVGLRGAREVREFLNTVRNAEMEVEISWASAENETFSWGGDYQAMSGLSRALGTFKLVEPTEIQTRGEVITLSARGKFELSSDGHLYAGTFPSNLLPQVANVHIGEEVVATLERTVVVNTVTQAEKVTYLLLSLAPSGQTGFVATE